MNPDIKDVIFMTLGWWLIATLFFGSIYLIGAFISWDWFWICSPCPFPSGYLRFSLIVGLIVGLVKGWVLYFYGWD